MGEDASMYALQRSFQVSVMYNRGFEMTTCISCGKDKDVRGCKLGIAMGQLAGAPVRQP